MKSRPLRPAIAVAGVLGALAFPAAAGAAQPVLALGFEQGSGTAATDSSGNGNHGVVDGATWTTGKNGGGLRFDGVDDIVRIVDSPSLRPSAAITMSGWVYTEGTGPYGYLPVVGKADHWLLYARDGGQNGVSAIFAQHQWWAEAAVPEETWTHVAATFTSTQGTLYINGDPVLANDWTLSAIGGDPNADIEVGASTIWGDFFDGKIDDVRVYQDALTEAEIETDMATALT